MAGSLEEFLHAVHLLLEGLHLADDPAAAASPRRSCTPVTVFASVVFGLFVLLQRLLPALPSLVVHLCLVPLGLDLVFAPERQADDTTRATRYSASLDCVFFLLDRNTRVSSTQTELGGHQNVH